MGRCSAVPACDQGAMGRLPSGLVWTLGVPRPPADEPGRASGLEALGVRVPDDSQDQAVFEQRLQGAQDDGEAAG